MHDTDQQLSNRKHTAWQWEANAQPAAKEPALPAGGLSGDLAAFSGGRADPFSKVGDHLERQAAASPRFTVWQALV